MKYKLALKIAIMTMVIIVFIASVVSVAFITYSMKSVNDMNSFFQKMQNQNTTSSIAFVYRRTVYYDQKEYDLFELAQKQNEEYYASAVFCIYDNRIYYVISHAELAKWYIASCCLNNTNDFKIHTELPNTPALYPVGYNNEDYKKKSGFYYNNKIVLNNGTDLLEYDLIIGSTNMYDADSYTFPSDTVIGNVLDGQTVEIRENGIVTTYTLNDMAETCSDIAQIIELKDKKRWDGLPCLDFETCFYENGLISINNRILLIGRCYSFSGDAFAFVLEYNIEKSEWKYVNGYHAGDNVATYSTIIPIIIS